MSKGYWDRDRQAWSNHIGSPIDESQYTNNKWRGGINESNVLDNQSQKVNTMSFGNNTEPAPEYDVEGHRLGDMLYDPWYKRPPSYMNKEDQDRRNSWRAMMNRDFGIEDDDHPFAPNPYKTPKFECGMNMPTFDVVKGGLDTAGKFGNIFLGFENLDLRRDGFNRGVKMGDKKWINDVTLGNNALKNANYDIEAKNHFNKNTKAVGDYVLQEKLDYLNT